MSPLTADALKSPAWLPFRVGPKADEVGLIRLGEADYRAASFLDGRLPTTERPISHADWSALSALAPPLRPAHFIFHIGHCGSTLVSRLLGEHPALFSLREPALLREAASGVLYDRLEPLVRLLSRTWRSDQTALIKATSFVSEIAPEILALVRGRVLLLGVTPPVYLRTILAGPNSRQEAAVLAPARQARLEARLGRPLAVRSEGERVAMSWLCEASCLHAIAETRPEVSLRLDFDAILADPLAGLNACFVHLGVDPGALDLEALVEGPLMRRYAKGPEHAYDAGLRAAVQAQAARDGAADIRAGMDWLQREADRDARVTEVLSAAAVAARRRPLAPAPTAG